MQEEKPETREAQEHSQPDSFPGYNGPDHETPEPADEAFRLGTGTPESGRRPPY